MSVQERVRDGEGGAARRQEKREGADVMKRIFRDTEKKKQEEDSA